MADREMEQDHATSARQETAEDRRRAGAALRLAAGVADQGLAAEGRREMVATLLVLAGVIRPQLAAEQQPPAISSRDMSGAVDQDDLLLGQLALALATGRAIGKRKRRRLRGQLKLIASDWGRQEQPTELRKAAMKMVRPMRRMIASEDIGRG